MKVLVLVNGLTHYYNLILNRINALPEIELIVVAPNSVGSSIGAGVHLDESEIRFRVVRANEKLFWPFYNSFEGLTRILLNEKPAIIVVPDIYMGCFVINPKLRLITWILGIKLIMQSIPFGLKHYDLAVKDCNDDSTIWFNMPTFVRRVIENLHIKKYLRRAYLEFRKFCFNMAHAHLNYIEEGVQIYGSYGVPREKIFITYNSPDTDKLIEIEKKLPLNSPLLPDCKVRLVHVGRLVGWKRVDMLIKVFARILKFNTYAELLIIGSGPEEDALKKLAIDLGINESVRFLGAIYDASLLARYLRESTIYVLAGMGGLSINDAMFNRLPVICSVCDGTEKKLVRNGYNGYFFDEGNEEDLFEKLKLMLFSAEKCKEMGRNSRKIIDEEVNIQTLINGYRGAFTHVSNTSSNMESN